MSEELSKGEFTEELLRDYFIDLGYFVVRSVKFRYREFDITDIDLFLYNKSSPFSRERTIVDIKRKKTPQAIERIFWAKGIQDVLGFEKAIVATTDGRPDVVEFGKKNQVVVLDNRFIAKIDERFRRKAKTRITEERFLELLKSESLGALYGDWKDKYEDTKSFFLKDINFNTCNRLLKSIREILDFLVASSKSEISLRLLFIHLSYFLISLDYSIRDLLFQEEDQRKQVLDNSFKFGQNGFQRTQEILGFVQGIVGHAPKSSEFSREVLQDAIDREVREVKSDLLAEFFCKQVNASRLFELGIAFEALAFTKDVPLPNTLKSEELSVIAVLVDFCSVDRKHVL